MGFLSGSQGAIQFGSPSTVNASSFPGSGWRETDTRVTNWTLNTTAQLLDTTTLGVYDKSSVYGLRTHTGTLRLLYYKTGNGSSTPASNSASWFINALTRAADEVDASSLPPEDRSIESVPVYLRLYLDEANRTGAADYIELTANINSVAYSSNVGELVALDVAFEATGRIARSRV